MELSLLLGELHPRLVPFPIVLLLTALLLDGAGVIWRSERAHWAGKRLMGLGTATLLVAFICGICAEIWAGRAGVPHHQIKWHELAATAAAWGFIGLTGWRLFLDGSRRAPMAAYAVCGLALYGMLALSGYLGGELVTEYGASVRGARADTTLSLHDLNTLAQRQTDKNLEYSDIMHRTAGSFVLVLTVAIFLRTLRPQLAPKLRWVGPALLMVGGVLLLFFADLDLYALTDLRQFYDREVQAHKLISLVLIGVGLRGLIRKPAPIEPTETEVNFQNRLVAVLALVGGGLLFTHVHTVAPYANVAAGVYINHIVMGFVALAIGAVKLLDEAQTSRRKWRTLLFPSLLFVESFLLITYTEGIPWWAGIGHYNRWGPNGGTVAPFGKVRAELVYDPETAQMDVRVLERFKDSPVRVPASDLDVIVSQRYQETAVPLRAIDANSKGASHFRGQAAFLQYANHFDARVSIPLEGKWRTGYFDPWVIPAIVGIPPNEVARFVCPMHEGIRATENADCKLCGMPLVPIHAKLTYDLHNAKYSMKLSHNAETVESQQPVTLKFAPLIAATGELVENLLVVHEYMLHLIITSDDLSYFDHIHPDRQPDGSFAIEYLFPRGGNFLLFADITPAGERAQVFRLPLKVEGKNSPPQPLVVAPALAREIGDYHVDLILQPRTLVAERHVQLSFRLSQHGKPVTDLWPYIGAMGHCVVVSEDTQAYLHSHPEHFTAAPEPGARGGPVVSFHTQFPRAGRYKIWGQFKRGEEIIIADFVVYVQKPILPRWLVNFLIFE